MAYLNTARLQWSSLRGAVAADDTALTSFNYSNWPSSNTLNLNSSKICDANGMVVAFHGTAAENKDFAYNLYGKCIANGPIMLLLTGVVTLGAQACTTDPIDNTTTIANGLWADTITATAGIFYDATNPAYRIYDAGNDMICILQFDQKHVEDIFCEIDLDGGSDAATSAYAIITGW